MSVLCVGLSHHTAPVDLIERATIAPGDIAKALHDLQQGAHIAESVVLSTCNRVEVYVHVSRFHGGVQEASELIARHSGVSLDELTEHLYVHYEERAIQHLFAVACGLDSMVIGEGHVLGQLRTAFRTAQDEGAVGRALGDLLREALRVGKRARAETGIGRAGASLVAVGLDVAAGQLGGFAGHRALVVGAGAMGTLAVAALHEAGAEAIVVANRTGDRARALAASVDGTAIGLDDIGGSLADVDVLVTATGAPGVIVSADDVRRGRGGRPLVVVDVALPRDVELGVRDLPGVTLVDLDTLRATLSARGRDDDDVEAVRRIVAEEVETYLASQRATHVTPTVVALRAKADALIVAELDRLVGRLPELAQREREEVAQAVRRVVDKLLHSPTVRVKELASSPGGDRYAEALRELFELDPHVPEALATVDLAAADLADDGGRA